MKCEICQQVFTNANSFRSHKSRLANYGLCKGRLERKKASEIIVNVEHRELVKAVQNNNNNEETLKELKNIVSALTMKIDQIQHQNTVIQQQNDQLKDMMIDMQSNPRLLIVSNKLKPLDQLDLRNPEFKPVLEILDKELPQYANLGNEKTCLIHAKAVKTLNSIHPTAVKEGEVIFFKSQNVLSKDTNYITTKAFIDAFSRLGYQYAKKACDDLKSRRESDILFQTEMLKNATKNAIPRLNEIECKLTTPKKYCQTLLKFQL